MERIGLKDGYLIFEPQFLKLTEADLLFEGLIEDIDWHQHYIKLFGKRHRVPRLTAWYADPGLHYQYSGIDVSPIPWTVQLLEVKRRLEMLFGATFNSVLLNRYRTGSDSVDWHSDDEIELGENPRIASLTLGACRPFKLKHRVDQSETYSLDLMHGSALFMAGSTQRYWRHKIPKTRKPVGERLNLTFRKIKNGGEC